MKNFKTYGQFLTEAYSDEERKELADKGFALSDGSFPIKDLKDLKNAIQAYGRAKDQARAAKFIVKRAKALGAEDLIPDTEDFQKSLGESVVTEAKMSKEKIENLIYSLENEKDSWHPSSDSKKKTMLDKLKKDLSKFESVVNEGLDKNKPYFDFLVALRDSGATNMFGATPYLQDAFGLSKSEARKILAEWMKSFNEGKLTEAKASVSKKDIKDIEDSGNIDIAYKKAMALLKSLSESVVTEAKDDYTARYKDTNINLKKGYKHLNDEELNQLYLEIGELISDNKLKVKNATLQFESVAVGSAIHDVSTELPAKAIALPLEDDEEENGSITEGTDLGSWNQGGLKGDKNVLVTQFVGPKAIEDFGLGRKCMQINVGMDYISLNPADIVELKDILKSYKVK